VSVPRAWIGGTTIGGAHAKALGARVVPPPHRCVGDSPAEAAPLDGVPIPAAIPAIGAAPPALGLRLNEIDYDQPSFDTGEFVEIVNVSSERYRLRHIALVFVNGSTSAEYRRVQLSGRLGPSRRLVVATSSLAVDGSARLIVFPLARDNVQNGSPDGVALVDTANGVVLDALSYEGSIDNATIDGLPGTFPLGEGQPVSEADDGATAGSLCRIPDRADSGDDDADWTACAPTPGTENTAAT
jgi:hypothetical protein